MQHTLNFKRGSSKHRCLSAYNNARMHHVKCFFLSFFITWEELLRCGLGVSDFHLTSMCIQGQTHTVCTICPRNKAKTCTVQSGYGVWPRVKLKKGYFTKNRCKENMGCEKKVKDEQSAEKGKAKGRR